MSSETSILPRDSYIIGSDEVGYGAWAGPLVVCAVAATRDWVAPAGLTDSKALSPAQRTKLYEHLYGMPKCIVAIPAAAIDRMGVRSALVSAHTQAVTDLLAQFPNADVIVDGVVALPKVPQARLVPKADATEPAVSAASIIAKVNRDYMMTQYHAQYPGYGFNKNAGYGTKDHQDGLRRQGICPLHRRSYSPIKKYVL